MSGAARAFSSPSRGAAPPHRTQQRLAALETANRVRLSIADLKQALRTGRVHGSVLFAAPPPEAARAVVRDLLRAVPGVGEWKAGKMLQRANAQPRTRLEALTGRQLAVLAEELAVHESKSRLLAAVLAEGHGLLPDEVDAHVERAARVAVEARR